MHGLGSSGTVMSQFSLLRFLRLAMVCVPLPHVFSFSFLSLFLLHPPPLLLPLWSSVPFPSVWSGGLCCGYSIGFYIVQDRSDRMSRSEGGVGGRIGGVFLENVCFPVSNLVGQRACSVRAPIHGTCCEDA